MNVYAVLLEDRHTDVHVEVFADRDEAIERARTLAKENARFPDDYKEETIEGWEFYCRYSCEDDSTRVVATELKEKS